MPTALEFFAREIRCLDRVIERIITELEAEPCANGSHNGMRALLKVKHHHRRIVEALYLQAHDFDSALDACRGRLIVVQAEHARISARGGANNLQAADAWWNTLNEIEYLASLTCQLQEAARRSAAPANGFHPADDGGWSPH